eukprot:3255643-Pyramimonas_sp.AAC.1
MSLLGNLQIVLIILKSNSGISHPGWMAKPTRSHTMSSVGRFNCQKPCNAAATCNRIQSPLVVMRMAGAPPAPL